MYLYSVFLNTAENIYKHMRIRFLKVLKDKTCKALFMLFETSFVIWNFLAL